MEALKKGTVEALMVAMRDRLGVITDLTNPAVASPTFEVRKKDDDALIQSGVWVPADQPGHEMTALVEIDTTLVGYVEEEEYKLYLSYSTGTENPKKGPLFFRVIGD